MSDRRLAIVILTWNGVDDTLDCLASLREAVGDGDRVIVVDNGSGDGTQEALAEHDWIDFVQNGANLGFAGGNNVGLGRALDEGYRWVLMLNNDTVVPPGALDALLGAAEDLPDAGVLQPLLVSHGDPERLDTMGLRPCRTFGAADVGMGARAAGSRETVEIFGACGAAMLFRAAALRRCGLLDEDLFVLAEDLDLDFRLRAEGFPAYLVRSATILHKRGISGRRPSGAAARRRKFWLQRNTVALALRYWPLRYLVLFSPLLLWRCLQALFLSGAAPDQPCRPLWRRYLGARRASRKALAAAGADRWFAPAASPAP